MQSSQPHEDRVQTIVIGAGVVGLAVARALAQSGLEVLILETNTRVGEETSARSNEVIHAGFLYPQATLKAKLCKPGCDLLYEYAARRSIPHKRIGKLMPAIVEDEIGILEALVKQGVDSGVTDLELLTRESVQKIEPNLTCPAALWSPSTGIIDTHALNLSLLADAEAAGAILAANSSVQHIEMRPTGFRLSVVDPAGVTSSIQCEQLVNAAGLEAERLAKSLSGDSMAVPKIYFAKGTFYTLQGKSPFAHLIVPAGPALAQGASYTFDMAGQGRFGPDLDWVAGREYEVDPTKAQKFHAAISGYTKSISIENLQPGYAGIRPRVTGPGHPPGDWVIAGPETHGSERLVHLLGMDTPGITACLSIAEEVKKRIGA